MHLERSTRASSIVKTIEAEGFLFQCVLRSVVPCPGKRWVGDWQSELTAKLIAGNHAHAIWNGLWKHERAVCESGRHKLVIAK